MKKIALLIVAALIVQLVPVNVEQVRADSASQNYENVETYASYKYYEILDADGNSYYPFSMASSSLRDEGQYSLVSVTVDGQDMTDKFTLEVDERYDNPNSYETSKYVYVAVKEPNFMEVSKEHIIEAVVSDENSETFTLSTTCVMEPYQNAYEILADETEYISTTGVQKTGIRFYGETFMTKSQNVTVSKVELVDQDGIAYGCLTDGENDNFLYSAYDYRYDDSEIQQHSRDIIEKMIGNTSNICKLSFYSYNAMYINSELKPGLYDLVYTLSDGTQYIYKKAYEAVTRPIVYWISDSEYPIQSEPVITDQTGNYVSIYVYGWNISKDSVKPVFYNKENEVISGDVVAVEKDKWGAFFRVEKNKTDPNDWNTSDDEGAYQATPRSYKVEIQTEEETYEKEVNIVYRDIFYQYYDQRDKSFTAYFSQEEEINPNYNITLSFEAMDYDTWEYVPFVTVNNGEYIEEINTLTGEKEKKVKFFLSDEQVELLKNSYNYHYSISYVNGVGRVKTTSSDYSLTHAIDYFSMSDVSEKGVYPGYSTKLFFLPYWIGGLYPIQPNDEDNYLLTKQDVEALSNGKYAYCITDDELTGETNFDRRSYRYYFAVEGKMPEIPEGTPTLSVSKQDSLWKFSWTEVSGAKEYGIFMRYNDNKEHEVCINSTSDNYIEIEEEYLVTMFREFFEEAWTNPDESKMGVCVRAINYQENIYLYGDASNVLTVSEIKNETHKHTEKTMITKAKYGKNGRINTVCSSCNKTINTTTIYAPKTVTVADITYNGRNQTPKVVVKDSKGNVIAKSNYTVSKVKNVGVNKITITFNSSSKNYTGTMTATVKVNPKATNLSSVEGKRKSIVAKWKKQTTQTKGYQIQYSTNKNFKSGVKTVTVQDNKQTSYTIKKLKNKKTYYVRVRTYNGKCYSAWSKSKTVKTK